MEEVLAKYLPDEVPLQQQEFYALSIVAYREGPEHGHLFRSCYGHWCVIDSAIMFDDVDTVRFSNYAEAKQKYEQCPASLVAEGFKYSDLEL